MGIPPTRYTQYPHEFSGGMRQRIMIALALVLRPAVVVADEPTTALDVLVEAQILRIIADLRRNFDTALLLITHNLGIVAEACDRVAVMYAGRIVEQGPAYDITTKPVAPVFARAAALDDLALDDEAALDSGRPAGPRAPAAGVPVPPALPGRDAGLRRSSGRRRRRRPGPPLGVLAAREGGDPGWAGAPARARGPGRRRRKHERRRGHQETLMEIRDLAGPLRPARDFRSRITGRGGGSVKAVDGVSFDLPSGRGARAGRRVGLGQDDARPRAARPGAPDRAAASSCAARSSRACPERALRPMRRHLQMVFQDPHASLNPGMTLETALAHPLQIHKLTKRRRRDAGEGPRDARARRPLTDRAVRLELPERPLGRPEAARGDRAGDHRRPGPAGRRRARLDARHERAGEDPRPDDRPQAPARADVRLRHARPGAARSSSATAWRSCTSAGSSRSGPSTQIFEDPKHPYTQALIRAIPEPDPDKALPRDLPRGEIPDAARPPLGCSFHPRCPKAFDICGWESRDLRSILEERWVEGGRGDLPTERALVGDLEKLEAARGVPPGRLRARTRASCSRCSSGSAPRSPTSRCGRASSAMTAEAHGVRVTFEPGIDPAAVRDRRLAGRLPALQARLMSVIAT